MFPQSLAAGPGVLLCSPPSRHGSTVITIIGIISNQAACAAGLRIIISVSRRERLDVRALVCAKKRINCDKSFAAAVKFFNNVSGGKLTPVINERKYVKILIKI